jgi:NTE family protein
MQSLDDSLAETALARLFVGRRPSPDVAWFSLPGGRTLYNAGDPADTLYFLRAGRLGVIRREEGQEQQFLGVIRPGEPAGEMALVAGTAHTASVLALRDSEVLALPGAAFFAEARRNPEIMAEVARLMIVRARERRAPAGEPTVFALVGVGEGLDIRRLAERIQAQITVLGFSSTVVGAEGLQAPTEWFSTVEQAHDVVLYAAEWGEQAWAQLCGRQVDRIILVGRGDQPPTAAPTAFAAEAMRQNRLIDLVLVQPEGAQRPQGSEAWLDAAPASRLFHLRTGSTTDEARLARVITGTSVGLVLSGGGARAYAHIGAVRALREAGVPLDFVGGSSMGGIVAAGVAMGWDNDEIEHRIRKAFVHSGPLTDIAFPMIAMTRGEKVRKRLHEHFDSVDISDLWLPFFCVSSNLTTGAPHIHRRGDLTWALRASSALPGVLPPIAEGDNVLVDGAVMRNFPADVMRTRHSGPIVGVDVSRSRGLSAEDILPPASILQWILSGDWVRGPPIVSLLMRAATVSTERDLQAAREATDVLITPRLDRIEIRDWRAFEPAVEAGFVATKAALDKLDRPVTHLRKAAQDHDHPLVAPQI